MESQYYSPSPKERKKYKASREALARERSSPSKCSKRVKKELSRVHLKLKHSSKLVPHSTQLALVPQRALSSPVLQVALSTSLAAQQETILVPATPEAFVAARNLLCLLVQMSPFLQESSPSGPLSLCQQFNLLYHSCLLPDNQPHGTIKGEACSDGTGPSIARLSAPLPGTDWISLAMIIGRGILVVGLRGGILRVTAPKQDPPISAWILSSHLPL